jgi:hypothetical protein
MQTHPALIKFIACTIDNGGCEKQVMLVPLIMAGLLAAADDDG